MSFKLNFLIFSVMTGLSSFGLAFQQSTNKTCSGTVWLSNKDNTAPANMTFKLEREVGNNVGKLTMSFEDSSAAGTYQVSNEQHLDAKFEIKTDDIQVSGKITQMDDSTIGVTGKLTSGCQEINFFSFDLKCSNN